MGFHGVYRRCFSSVVVMSVWFSRAGGGTLARFDRKLSLARTRMLILVKRICRWRYTSRKPPFVYFNFFDCCQHLKGARADVGAGL